MGKNAPRRAGFTLVEFLTVTAIVGTVAALLMPSLSAARDKSKAAACVNNLRQLGHALFVYQDDCNTLPNGTHSGYALWNGTNYVLAGQMILTTGTPLARSFYCPASRLFSANDPVAGLVHLGVPEQFVAGSYEMRGLNDGAPRQLGGRPVALMADIFFGTGSARNHPGGVNVLFADGAVRYVSVPAHWNSEAAGAWDDLDRAP